MSKRENSPESPILADAEYMPSSFDYLKYFGIRFEYKDLNKNELSYLDRENIIIYISDKYINDSYATKHLLAHELGHFFLHEDMYADMNIFSRKTNKEYEANIFSILLMPQIMAGENWHDLSPRGLNKMVYNKVFRKYKK